MPDLEIVLTADGQQLSTVLNKAESELTDLERQLAKTFSGKEIQGMSQQLSAVQKGFTNVANSSKQANQVLINTGRIVSDLPFTLLSGNLIAVSNNIEPFIESFRRARQEAASGKALFQSLAGTFLGPGGIVFAVSAITAALTFFSAKMSQASRDVKAVEDANKSINNTVAEEATKVGLLVEVLKSETTSRREKLAAIKELKSINPEFFGQLTEEKATVTGLTTAYDGYIENLKAVYQVKALEGQVTELFKKRGELMDKSLTQTDKAVNKQKALNQELLKASKAGIPDSTQLNKFLDKVSAGKGIQIFDLTDTPKQLSDIDAQIGALLARIVQLGNTSKIIKDPLGKDKIDKGLTLAQLFTIQRQKLKEQYGKLSEEASEGLDKYIDALAKAAPKVKSLQEDLFNKGLSQLKAPTAGINLFQNIAGQEKVAQLVQQLKALGQTPPDLSWLTDAGAQAGILQTQLDAVTARLVNTATVVQELVLPAFGAFFEALVTGSKNPFQAFTQALKQLIAHLVATVAEAAILAAILSTITGGGTFMATFTSVLKGGGGTGAILGGLLQGNKPGQARPSALQTQPGVFPERIELVAHGQDLYGVIQLTSQTQGRKI